MALPFIGILDMAIAPNQGFAHHDKDSPFAYGVALYPPFAAGMRHNDLNDPYRFLGALSSITRLVASPGVSYRVSNTLSVGASVGLGMTFMAFETRMRTPNDMVAMTGALGEATKGLEIPVISELTLPAPWFGGGLSPYEDVGGLKFFAQDLFNASYNVGLLWDPYSWFSFGAVYQSETDADLKGKYTFDYSPRMQKTINWMGSSPMTIIIAAMLGLPTSCPAQESGTMSTNIVFPQRVQFGIKFQPHPKIKFLVDANWADWAAWKTNTITFDRDMKQMQMAKLMGYTGGNRTLTEVNDFKNVWYLGYGLELKPSDHFTLRLGYEFRPSSVNDQYFGPLPQGDVSLYSIGIGFDKPAAEVPARRIKGFEAFQKQLLHPDHIDLGFTFMTGNYTVHYNQSKLMNSTNFTDIVYNPFAGLIYHQTTTSYIISLNQIFKF
jgi:long-subunit fatty acid transport protein